MQTKQITVEVYVREEYAYDTQGHARVEIDIPTTVLDSIDFGSIANALRTAAVNENDRRIAEKQRQADEKEADEKRARELEAAREVLASFNGTEPVPA